MSRFSGEELQGAEFVDSSLRGATFRESDLRGVRMRGVWLADADIDGEIQGLTVNGVEVLPLIEAELDRRHPERAALRARTPEEFRTGWHGLEELWAGTVRRVAGLPDDTVDVSVDGEWSFAETLRHLVFATDAWLGPVLGHPFHPLGMPFRQWRDRSAELGIDLAARPSYADVLEVRADRQAMVHEFLDGIGSGEELDRLVDTPPWEDGQLPLRASLGVIMTEEWQHHRFAVRDLDRLTGAAGPPSG